MCPLSFLWVTKGEVVFVALGLRRMSHKTKAYNCWTTEGDKNSGPLLGCNKGCTPLSPRAALGLPGSSNPNLQAEMTIMEEMEQQS